MTTIQEIIRQSIKRLKPVSDSPRLDVELLLCITLEKDRTFLHTWPEQKLQQHQLLLFETQLSRRIQGEPIAHITGEREFWTLTLDITKDTLIPRPETERLVELTLELIPENTATTILDLGTGNGAIALSLAKERPASHITATDTSLAALQVAKQNARKCKISNIGFIQSHWFTELANLQFDFIVSNPPYIRENDDHLEEGDVRFEPRSALTSGLDGLDDLSQIISKSPTHLNEAGILLLEHAYDQADAVCHLLEVAGFQPVNDFKDYNDLPRIAVGSMAKRGK